MKIQNILIVVMLIFGLNVRAQRNDHRDPGPKFDPPVKSLPVFLDSTKLRNDLKNSKDLKRIYWELKKSQISKAYSYEFQIDTSGKLLLVSHRSTERLKNLTKYVENIFVKYQWIPGYRLNCNKCPVRVIGSLDFFFETNQESEILCQLQLIVDKRYTVFVERIVMESDPGH